MANIYYIPAILVRVFLYNTSCNPLINHIFIHFTSQIKRLNDLFKAT